MCVVSVKIIFIYRIKCLDSGVDRLINSEKPDLSSSLKPCSSEYYLSRPRASESSGIISEIQSLRPHPRPNESKSDCYI